MEEKESTNSGSPSNTDSGSPNPISFMGGGGVVAGPLLDPPSVNALGSGEIKKKRGRPRKFDENGNLNPAYTAALARRAAKVAALTPTTPEFSLTNNNNNNNNNNTASASALLSPNSTTSYEFAPGGGGTIKKGRVRTSSASASANSQSHPLAPCSISEVFADTAGVDFTPHVITVQTGEDVAAKIHALGHKAPRGICVLSANGAISNVTIRQPGASGGGLLTYEGRFEILSLSGSYTVSEAGGITSKTGGLSIAIAGPDGRVVGGSVAGWIIAANPIQVVAGTFVPNGHKAQKRKYHRDSHTRTMSAAFPNQTPAEIPNTQSMHHYHEAGPPTVTPMPAYSHTEADDSIDTSHETREWNNGSEPHRFYPDINVSVPGL
ncbi:hypothetical protein KSS87_014263 [Heliosperma pusillum]|nr:hypothetical protein KSS87_014263 [Heliosperma pusillum]